jgi:glutathione peroxidase
MKNPLLFLAALFACGTSVKVRPVDEQTTAAEGPPPASFFDLNATDINGKPYPFADLKGHRVMIVNTASECGYTPQYKQLEELYRMYKDQGLVILGFPSNDFGAQEPGDEKAIAHFCEFNYGVTFPLMSKVHTKGAEQHPVYQWLTKGAKNGKFDSEVKWNFQKYLVNADGTLQTVLPSAADPLGDPVLNWLEGK